VRSSTLRGPILERTPARCKHVDDPGQLKARCRTSESGLYVTLLEQSPAGDDERQLGRDAASKSPMETDELLRRRDIVQPAVKRFGHYEAHREGSSVATHAAPDWRWRGGPFSTSVKTP
jgi:hypothetical protein